MGFGRNIISILFERVQTSDCYCWIGTSIFLLIISVKFILKHNYKNKIVLFLHSYFCQSSLPLCHYNTTTQNNMILSYAAVHSGLWVLLNARFLRQAPHRPFCFAFFLGARGITISSTNLCLLISHQTQTPQAHTRLLGPPVCLYLGNAPFPHNRNILYLCC